MYCCNNSFTVIAHKDKVVIKSLMLVIQYILNIILADVWVSVSILWQWLFDPVIISMS